MNENDKLDDLAELQKRIGSLDREMLLRYRVCRRQRDEAIELLWRVYGDRCNSKGPIDHAFNATATAEKVRQFLNEYQENTKWWKEPK